MNVEAQRISPAPIRKSLRVRASREKAFDTFVGRHGRLVAEDPQPARQRGRRTW